MEEKLPLNYRLSEFRERLSIRLANVWIDFTIVLHSLRVWASEHLVEILGLLLLAFAVIVVGGGYVWTRSIGTSNIVDFTIPDFVSEIFSNFGTELFSIAVTILVVDYLNRRRQENELKKQLIRQLGSKSNDFALFAAGELRERGWLTDGTLNGADLHGASLQGSDLRGAVLHLANFGNANLSGANLAYAKLANADLSDANLVNACLSDAEMVGTFLIGANLGGADLRGADLSHFVMSNTILVDTDLSLARYDNETIWPIGFNPEITGAINVDKLRETSV